MEYIKITKEDIKRSLDDETKHLLALNSCIDKVDVNTYLEPIVNIANGTINAAIGLANALTNALPKEYWEARKQLEINR